MSTKHSIAAARFIENRPQEKWHDEIDAEGAQRGADGSHFREVDDADERMQRLAAQRVVVVEDVVYSYDVVHHSVRI